MLLFHLGGYTGVEFSGLTVLRNCQTVFQHGCIILRSYQKHMQVQISPHPCRYLLLFVLFFHDSQPISSWF